MRPFYDLIANIAAEEYGHIELVSYAINLLLTGTTKRGDDPTDDAARSGDGRPQHATTSSPAASRRCRCDSMGNPWTGANVFSSGNLKLDLLHNFFLECGARANKIRVYEMVDDPTARAMVGYLLVRGGVHIVAYAKALEKLTGVDVGKLLPIPDISNKQFPEAREARGPGAAPDPLPLQPRRLPRGRRDLERAAPRGRQRARGRGRSPEGFDAAGPASGAAADRADRAGHRPGNVRRNRRQAVSGAESEEASRTEGGTPSMKP